jgi:hypothetical protein
LSVQGPRDRRAKGRNLVERLRSDGDSFYSFFLKTMMKFDDRALKEAKVVIDGSGDREFKRNLSTYIQRHVQVGAVSQIKLKSSRAEPLLQLADMCVGAIARSYRTDRRDPNRWSGRLAGRIDDLWEFK